MSRLAEDLEGAAAAIAEAEELVAQARGAEVDAIITGDTAGAADRRKRLAAAEASLDAARRRESLVREAAEIAEKAGARARLEEEVQGLLVAHGHGAAACAAREAETRAALSALVLALARQHAAFGSLVSLSNQLRLRVGDAAPHVGAAWDPVISPSKLQLLLDDLRPGLADQLGPSSVVNVHLVGLRIPVLDATAAPAAKE